MTGAAGFIGAHVVKALVERGDEVVGVDNFNDYYNPQLKADRISIFLKNYPVKIYRLDIADANELKKVFAENQIDKICHLAAQAGVRYSLENPGVYISANIVGTHNILESCRQFGIKHLVFASSSSVYGNNDKIPFAETDPVDRPISLYAATKKSNELEAYTYHHLFGLNAVGLRFFTVYGPWGRPDMAYFKFSDLISQGKPIDVYNQGNLKRDFTYVDDIVAGIKKAIDYCRGYEIFNLGNNQPVVLHDFIEILEKHLGQKARKNFLPLQPGDVLATYADIIKAKKILDWEPQTKIEDGLHKFVAWYREYNS